MKTAAALVLLGLSAPLALSYADVKKPANAAPVNLGNGVLLLGEDAPIATKPAKNDRRSMRSSPIKIVKPQLNLNTALVNFCRARLGQRVGNGQCSELAVYGLPAIGAKLDFNNMWGSYVCQYSAAGGRMSLQLGPAGYNPQNRRMADVRPGDIIQFENVKFEKRWDTGYSFQNYPHHTAVISSVSKDGRTYQTFEQNSNGRLFVVQGSLFLPDLTEGTMRISRPMPR